MDIKYSSNCAVNFLIARSVKKRALEPKETLSFCINDAPSLSFLANADIDATRLVIDRTLKLKHRLLYGGIIIFFMYFLLSFWIKDHLGYYSRYGSFSYIDVGDIVGAVIIFLLLVFGLLGLIECVLAPKRHFVFDRMNQTFSMPSSWLNWRGKNRTVAFTDAFFYPCFSPKSVGGTCKVYTQFHLWGQVFDTYSGTSSKDMCFAGYVWYMDKNRPLPPNKALDPHRNKDYLRRKSEGFPLPLYAGIYTPEWDGAKNRYEDFEADYRYTEEWYKHALTFFIEENK